MDQRSLYRLAAFAAMLGGGLRIFAAFLPWQPANIALETLAGVIDICLLFGFSGLYFATAAQTGRVGFIGFVLGATGIASIIGPDPVMFGLDFYQLGAFFTLIGTALLAVAWYRTGSGPALAAIFWLAAAVLGPLGTLLPWANLTFLLAGLLFGAGFVIAGRWLLIAQPLPDKDDHSWT